MEKFKIKNIETGFIFDLDEDEAKRVLASNVDKFIAIDGNISIKTEESNANVSVGDLVKGTVDFEGMNIPALRKFAKEQNIDLKGCGNSKENIIARIKGE